MQWFIAIGVIPTTEVRIATLPYGPFETRLPGYVVPFSDVQFTDQDQERDESSRTLSDELKDQLETIELAIGLGATRTADLLTPRENVVPGGAFSESFRVPKGARIWGGDAPPDPGLKTGVLEPFTFPGTRSTGDPQDRNETDPRYGLEESLKQSMSDIEMAIGLGAQRTADLLVPRTDCQPGGSFSEPMELSPGRRVWGGRESPQPGGTYRLRSF